MSRAISRLKFPEAAQNCGDTSPVCLAEGSGWGTLSLPTPPCHPEMHPGAIIRAFRAVGFLDPMHIKGIGVEHKSRQMLVSCEECERAGGCRSAGPGARRWPSSHSCILYYKMTAVVIAT